MTTAATAIGRRRWLGHCSAWLAAAASAAFATAGAKPARAATTTTTTAAAGAQPTQPGQPPQPARRGAPRPTVLVVGDSLSAEYGLARGSGWVALLEKRLASEGIHAEVLNASISGDTTAGGRARLPALLARHRPQVVVIELGGNDALRGLQLASTRANLREMARASKSAGARVVIVGMQIPPNFGRRYADEFAAVFAEVARSEGTALVPFLLKGVADIAQPEAMFQSDRIHPLAAAHPRMLDNVWPVLKPLLAPG